MRSYLRLYNGTVSVIWSQSLIEKHEHLAARILTDQHNLDDVVQDWILHCLLETLNLRLDVFDRPLGQSLLEDDEIKEMQWGRELVPEVDIDCVKRDLTLLEGLSHGEPEILTAIRLGQVDLCRCFMQKDYGIFEVVACGSIGLHIAAEERALDIFQFLMQNGVDVNTKNEFELTPLHAAVYHESHELVQALLDAGADVNSRPSLRRYTTTCRRAVPEPTQQGSDYEKRQIRDSAYKLFNEYRSSVLHVAAWRGNLNTIGLLMSHGETNLTQEEPCKSNLNQHQRLAVENASREQRDLLNNSREILWALPGNNAHPKQTDVNPQAFFLGIQRLYPRAIVRYYDAEVATSRLSIYTNDVSNENNQCIISEWQSGQITCTHSGAIDCGPDGKTTTTSTRASACVF